MDLSTGQRTFYVGVSGVADGQIIEVPFRDSASNLMRCNYISVNASLKDANSASDVGNYVAELSGVSHEGDMIGNTLSGLSTTPAASGICGFGGVTVRTAITKYTWHGSNEQVATGIKIQTTATNGTMTYAITYGNLYPLNPIRLEQSYDAGL